MNGILRQSWKPLSIGVLGIALLLLAACGNASSTGSSGKSQAATQDVTLSLLGHEKGNRGPDALRHDTYSPSSITTTLGTTVKVTILNYDDMAHSFTAPDLGLNVIVQRAKDGQPTANTFTFTPTRTGKFRFFCAIPCDSDANGWAMKPDSGGPGQEGFMAGYVIVS